MDQPCLHLNSYLRGAPMDQALMLRIRERAYHIWTATGADADQNWLRAETEMLNNFVAQPSVAQPRKTDRVLSGGRRRKRPRLGRPLRCRELHVFSRNALLLRYVFGTLSICSLTTFAVTALARAAVRAVLANEERLAPAEPRSGWDFSSNSSLLIAVSRAGLSFRPGQWDGKFQQGCRTGPGPWRAVSPRRWGFPLHDVAIQSR